MQGPALGLVVLGSHPYHLSSLTGTQGPEESNNGVVKLEDLSFKATTVSELQELLRSSMQIPATSSISNQGCSDMDSDISGHSKQWSTISSNMSCHSQPAVSVQSMPFSMLKDHEKQMNTAHPHTQVGLDPSGYLPLT